MAQKILRRKKKWFMIIAPEVFKNKELFEIPAFEPDELVNRLVEVHCIIFNRDKIFHCKENLNYCLRDIEKMIRDHVKELYEHLDIIPFWKKTDSILD